MAQSPSYTKVPLQDPGHAPSAPPADGGEQHGYAPPPQVYDPPPPYEAGYYQPPQGFQPTAAPPQAQAIAYAPLNQVSHQLLSNIKQCPPAPVIPQQPATIVVTQTLAPGICSVCRKGKIKDSSTFCTYVCCLFWCVFGCLPGILAFMCCCRKPKCTHCGYTVD